MRGVSSRRMDAATVQGARAGREKTVDGAGCAGSGTRVSVRTSEQINPMYIPGPLDIDSYAYNITGLFSLQLLARY
jgi:hypothetical protein